MRPAASDSVNVLRIKFFMLLCENEDMKKRISGKRTNGLIAPLCLEKARLFYDELCDELIPEFLQVQISLKKCFRNYLWQDESISLAEFVDKLRTSYLHS